MSPTPAGYAEDAAYLTHYGFAVAVIQYRLVDATTHTNEFPEGMQDARCAVRFLRANPNGYAYDVRRIGVLGGSAGGHMVAMLGVLPAGALPPDTFADTPECLVGVDKASSGVDAVAAYFPLVNVTEEPSLKMIWPLSFTAPAPLPKVVVATPSPSCSTGVPVVLSMVVAPV